MATVLIVDSRVVEIVEMALASASEHRGGQRLIGDIANETGVRGGPETARILIQNSCLVGGYQDEELVGIGALSPIATGVILGVFVGPGHRRHHVAKKILRHIVERHVQPTDAWVLPGDRASKSLYESVGWKARRLTMSGE